MITNRIAAAFLVFALATAGCFPGHCDGAFRWLSAGGESDEADRTRAMTIAAESTFVLNSDSAEATPAELLARSKVGPETFFIAGAGGRVNAGITARYAASAHSCASAASFTLKPAAPLAPGDYTVVLLLDETGWPAVFDGDVTSYEGKRALVRRYHVDRP